MKKSVPGKPAQIQNADRMLWAEESVRAMAQSNGSYAVIVLDIQGKVLTWNAGAERMLGYSADDSIGRQFVQFFPADEVARDRHKAYLESAASAPFADEVSLTRGDRITFPASVTLAAIRDPARGLRGFTCLLHDQTETQQVEELMRQLDSEGIRYKAALAKLLQDHTARFREADELFRQLTINIPHAIWIREATGKTLRYINPAWSKMTGVPAAAGDPEDRLYSAYHPDDLPLVMRETRKFPNGGMDFDCRITSPGEAVIWVRIRTFPIADAAGTVVRVAGIMEDITARRADATHMQRLKDEFVATVSHELRTPLTSIAGALGLVFHSAEALPDPAAHLVKIALTNSERLVRLINGILDIEKIESGNVAFDMRRVRLHPVVEQAIESVHGLATASGVQVLLDSECVHCEVRADPDRIIQVVTNLLANAIKFSPSGKKVAVALSKATDVIRVSVRDHGPGIPVSFRERVFKKFAQAHSSNTRNLGGTGLGLSIAREIVHRLGGEIGFEDAPGGGTCFYFELPDWATLAKVEQALEPTALNSERNAA